MRLGLTQRVAAAAGGICLRLAAVAANTLATAVRLALRRWTVVARPTRCNRGSGFGPTPFSLLPTHRHVCCSVHMCSISTRHILPSRQGVYDVAESTPVPQTPGTSPHCDSYQALQLTHPRNLPELDLRCCASSPVSPGSWAPYCTVLGSACWSVCICASKTWILPTIKSWCGMARAERSRHYVAAARQNSFTAASPERQTPAHA
jgi:hypothetical protein